MIRLSLPYTHDYDKPERHSPEAAGYDLISTERATIYPGEAKVLPTGFVWGIPDGWFGLIKGRSSLTHTGLVVTAGVVDSDYRGEVKVALVNTSTTQTTIEPGQRIAQMVIISCLQEPTAIVAVLPKTSRTGPGFGVL